MLRESSIVEIEDLLLKVIIIGDSSVGKSNIVFRFTQDQFRQGHQSTIGVDFKMKSIMIDKARLKLQLWDTAGQERYKTLAKTYYRGACGIILVYSIVDQSSFENIEKWIIEIYDHLESPGEIVLVGNKVDMESERKVAWEKGRALADKYSAKFMEVSARTGESVNQLFMVLGAQILKDLVAGEKERKNKVRNKKLENKCGKCSC